MSKTIEIERTFEIETIDGKFLIETSKELHSIFIWNLDKNGNRKNIIQSIVPISRRK